MYREIQDYTKEDMLTLINETVDAVVIVDSRQNRPLNSQITSGRT